MNYVKLKAKFLNPFFYEFFLCACIKTSQNLSAKYYQKTDKDSKKRLPKGIKIHLKKKKKKSGNMVVNVTKIS